MSQWRINLLGTLEINKGENFISGFESDKVRALLAYLAIENNKNHHREILAGLLWPESPPDRARQSLSQALYNLRRILCQDANQAIFFTTNHEIIFNSLNEIWVDAHEFNALIMRCQNHHHDQIITCRFCLDLLEDAVSLYNGDFLAGISLKDCEVYEEWLLQQRQFYMHQVERAMAWLAQGLDLIGENDSVIQITHRWVSIDQFDEAAVRQYMSALAKDGKRNEALLAYKELCSVLSTELRVEPDVETQQLYQKIRQSKETILLIPPNNLPSQLTPFFGRKREITELRLRFWDPTCRLITLVGHGGIGKTRLALELTKNILTTFPDGVFFIDFNGKNTLSDFIPAIYRLLNQYFQSPQFFTGSRECKDFPEQVYRLLKDKTVLLILDSFEKMIAESSMALFELLRNTTKVKILVTSRERIIIQGEHLFKMEGLDVPPSDFSDPVKLQAYSATELFISTAKCIDPYFEITNSNLLAVKQICQDLEGSPLGIILAASWAGEMQPEDIATQMKINLDFLASEWKDLPSRQRSLRASFIYSWSRLSSQEQSALCSLAIFQQAFAQNLAFEICQVSLSQLTVLQDHSLIQSSGEHRYRLHDTVHTYVLEKLNADLDNKNVLMDRFTTVYLGLMKTWSENLRSARLNEVMAEMDLEFGNVRFALEWAALQFRFKELLDGLPTMCRFFLRNERYEEGTTFCKLTKNAIQNQGLNSDSLHLWARLIAWEGNFLKCLSNLIEAVDCFEYGFEELNQPTWKCIDTRWEQAFLARQYGAALFNINNLRSLEYFQLSLNLFRQVGTPWEVAHLLSDVANVYEVFGKFDKERELLFEAVELLGEDADPELDTWFKDHLGYSYLMSGDQVKGMYWIHQAVEGYDRLGNCDAALNAIDRFALSLIWSGNFIEALQMVDESKILRNRMKLPESDLQLIIIISCSNLLLGNYLNAINDAMEIKDERYSNIRFFILGGAHLILGSSELAISELNTALECSCVSYDRRIFSLTLTCLSLTQYRCGKIDDSRQLLIRAMDASLEDQNVFGVNYTLAIVASLFAEHRHFLTAVELYSCALQHPCARNSVFLNDLVGNLLHVRTSNLNKGEYFAAQTRGKSLDALEILHNLLIHLKNSNNFRDGLEGYIASLS